MTRSIVVPLGGSKVVRIGIRCCLISGDMVSSGRQFFTSLVLWQKSRRPRQLVRYSKGHHHVASLSSKATRIGGLIKQSRRPIAGQIFELARNAQVKPTLGP